MARSESTVLTFKERLEDPEVDATLLLREAARSVCTLENFRALIAHPNTDINATDSDGRTAAMVAVKSGQYLNADAILTDHRACLAWRDTEGRSICSFAPERDRFRKHRFLNLIRSHEINRLQRAKKQVKVLRNLSIISPMGIETFFPEELLVNYVLPYTADVINPLHGFLGGSNLD